MKATLYFDGSISKKYERVSYGFVIIKEFERVEIGPVPLIWPDDTVNTAEYNGLIEGMKKALELGVTDLEVIGDSQLVIYQVLGKYKCKQPHLKELLVEAHQIARKFDSITFEWKRRVHNEADAVSRMG